MAWTSDELAYARDVIAPADGFLCPLPQWAERHAFVGGLELGSQLPTRDGRRHGNAVVVDLIRAAPGSVEVCGFLVITDAGNEMTFTCAEIEDEFYPPMFIMRRDEWPKKRERL